MRSLEMVLSKKKKQRNEIAGTRKLQWRNLDDLIDKMPGAIDIKNISLSTLRKFMPRATAQGLDALTRIVMQNFELIDIKCKRAVEVAAHNLLFM